MRQGRWWIAAGVVSNGILNLRAKFEAATFDARITRVAWVLDTDHDVSTGSPGLFGAPGVSATNMAPSSDHEAMGAGLISVHGRWSWSGKRFQERWLSGAGPASRSDRARVVGGPCIFRA